MIKQLVADLKSQLKKIGVTAEDVILGDGLLVMEFPMADSKTVKTPSMEIQKMTKEMFDMVQAAVDSFVAKLKELEYKVTGVDVGPVGHVGQISVESDAFYNVTGSLQLSKPPENIRTAYKGLLDPNDMFSLIKVGNQQAEMFVNQRQGYITIITQDGTYNFDGDISRILTILESDPTAEKLINLGFEYNPL